MIGLFTNFSRRFFRARPVLVFTIVLITSVHVIGSSATDLFKLSPEKRLELFLSKEFVLDERLRYSNEMMDSLLVIAKEQHDEQLCWYIKLYIYLRRPGPWNLDSDFSRDIAANCPFPEIEALFSHYSGLFILGSYGNYDSGLKLLLHAKAAFEKIGYENLPYGGECLNELGLYYFYSGYFPIAIKYWKRAYKQRFVDNRIKVSVLNNLGQAYMYDTAPDYQQATNYFLMCYNLAKKYAKVYCPISFTYYGQALHLQGKSAEALPFLIYGYKYNPKNEGVLRAKSALMVADAYLSVNKLEKAKKYLELYEEAIKVTGPLELKYNKNIKIWSPYVMYYNTKANYLKKTGDFAKANFYRQSMLTLQDSINQLTVYKVLDTSENIINTEKYFSDSDKIRQEREKELTIQNVTIALLLFLGLGTSYVVNQRRLKLLKEKELLEKSQVYINQQVERRREILSEYLQLVQDKTECWKTFRSNWTNSDQNPPRGSPRPAKYTSTLIRC
jgi:GTPase SAR1 family protein